MNEELKKSNSETFSICEIFFNDFYKYINKNKGIRFMNKSFKYEPNSKIKSKKKTTGQTIFDVEYNINEYGYRTCICNKNAKDTYIFAGCSLVFGTGLNDNETLPYFFSKLLNFNSNIINIGYPGGGPHTSLNEFNSDTFKNIIKGKNIKYVFFCFLQDHLFRAFVGRFQDKIFRLKGNKIILKDKNFILKSKLFDTIVSDNNFMYFINKIYKDKEINLSVAIINELNNIIKEKYNSKLIVFSCENNEDINIIFNELNKYGIETIKIELDYSSKPEGYYNIIGDGHPTSNANKEIADILFSYIKKKNV